MILGPREQQIVRFALSFMKANFEDIQTMWDEDDEPVCHEEELRALHLKVEANVARPRPQLREHRPQTQVYEDPVWSHNANMVHTMLQEVFAVAGQAGIQIEYIQIEDGTVKECVELHVSASQEAGMELPGELEGTWCCANPDIDRTPTIIL
jgi:hypothetical protein